MSTTTTSSTALPRGVTRPIPGELLRLALPVLASQGLRLGYQWVDALWVRGLGVDATAAVTSSIFVLWWVMAMNDIFSTGVTAFTSQLLGAGDRARAGVAAYKGLRASALLGLSGSVFGIFGAHAVFRLMGADAGLMHTGPSYLGVVLLGSPFILTALTCESIMRAAGDTRTPLLLDLFAIGLNAALDPFLIYGIGPFPRLGVAGAAWATVIAQAVLVLLYFVQAWRGHRAFPFARRAPGAPIRILGMATVGIPAAIIGCMFSVVYISFARAASHYGAAAMAIVGIVNRIEALQFIASVAIGTAGAALVGQNLGAGRPDRAVETIRVGNLGNLAITATLTVVMWVFADAFLSMFTRDPEVHRLGVPYLRVLVLCFIVNGFEIVTAESVLGSGHTQVLSIIFTSFSLLRIPLAFLVPVWTGTGVIGIAWVITLTCIVRGLLIVAWAARGTWKTGLRQELRAGGIDPVSVDPGAQG